MRSARAIALAMLLMPALVAAFDKLDGWFIAIESCEAVQSKNKGTNPGGVRTDPDRAYEMIGINEPGGDHYQVRVPGAPVTEERWVRSACGVHVPATVQAPDAGPGRGPGTVSGEGTRPNERESDDNLLALSWQPAFCETRPRTPECRELNAGGLPDLAARLSLHGLWPQPRGNDYCEVAERLVRLDLDNRWDALPEVEIARATRDALAEAMPGTASFLDRHEWIKHGTCYRGAGGAQEYFDDMLGLTEELNDSAVARFLAANRGRQVRAADIEAAFDRAFGRGAGDRVELVCERDGRRTLIVGIHIALGGVIGPETGLARLMQAARPVERSCDRGILDPPGLQ
jgi:ribonuclease T2